MILNKTKQLKFNSFTLKKLSKLLLKDLRHKLKIDSPNNAPLNLKLAKLPINYQVKLGEYDDKVDNLMIKLDNLTIKLDNLMKGWII